MCVFYVMSSIVFGLFFSLFYFVSFFFICIFFVWFTVRLSGNAQCSIRNANYFLVYRRLFVQFPEVNSFTFFFVSCHILFLASGSRINLTIFCMQAILSHNNDR